MSFMKSVYVVDDDSAVRDSLRWLLESVGKSVVCFADADAFNRSFDADDASCVLVDIRLPAVSGLELQQRLRETHPEVPVIIITGHGDVPAAVQAMKAGAIDFLEKPFSDHRLLDCIERAVRQRKARHMRHETREQIHERLEQLTPRECEVLDLVVAGRLNKQIAADLGLSPKTVEVHRAHVMQKMKAESLAQLVRMTVLAGDDLTAEIKRLGLVPAA